MFAELSLFHFFICFFVYYELRTLALSNFRVHTTLRFPAFAVITVS